MSKRFISYFTSVISIGMVSEAEGTDDAHRMANNLLGGDAKLDCCYFDQTEFSLIGTEPWEPEFEAKQSSSGLDFHFDPSKRTKRVIGLMLQKDPDTLTASDYETFVKQSIQLSLRNNNDHD